MHDFFFFFFFPSTNRKFFRPFRNSFILPPFPGFFHPLRAFCGSLKLSNSQLFFSHPFLSALSPLFVPPPSPPSFHGGKGWISFHPLSESSPSRSRSRFGARLRTFLRCRFLQIRTFIFGPRTSKGLSEYPRDFPYCWKKTFFPVAPLLPTLTSAPRLDVREEALERGESRSV